MLYMSTPEDFGSYLKEVKTLLREYLETRLKSTACRVSAYFQDGFDLDNNLLFLLFVIIVFFGLVTGFWLSELTGSYFKGFGLTTIMLIIVFGLLAAFRNALFVSPIIRAIIDRSGEEHKDEPNLPNL
jgi:hypothetical protein